MIEVKSYWQLPPDMQQKTLSTVKGADLEARAREKGMLVHQGKLIYPDAYPCTCSKQSPYHCFEQNIMSARDWTAQEKATGTCACPCHTYWNP